jgi:hypothetical protein
LLLRLAIAFRHIDVVYTGLGDEKGSIRARVPVETLRIADFMHLRDVAPGELDCEDV